LQTWHWKNALHSGKAHNKSLMFPYNEYSFPGTSKESGRTSDQVSTPPPFFAA